MSDETYLSGLAAHLQLRGVADERIRDIAAEVENHLVESGESPEDAFGPVADYAEKMAEFDETRSAAPGETRYHNRTFRATAFDEMDILAEAGRDGWELLDVGGMALFCRRPVDRSAASRWEYKRRIGRHRTIIRQEMAREQWEPCGNWMPFHYFKRWLQA